MPQTDLEGLDPTCRRFRLENGESLAEIDEVSYYFNCQFSYALRQLGLFKNWTEVAGLRVVTSNSLMIFNVIAYFAKGNFRR